MADRKLWTLTGPTVSIDKCLQDLVFKASVCYPHHVAVVFDDCTDAHQVIKYTYSELTCMSSWIQQILHKGHYQLEVIGVLCLDQPTLPAWLVGILSTPAAFLPMARDLTNTRIRDFIKRLKMRIILTDSIGKQKMEHLIPDLIDVIHNIQDLMTVSSMEVSVDPTLLDYLDLYFVILKTEQLKWNVSDPEKALAYVITTSGSTGTPKIVRVPHHCILSNIIHISEIYKLSSTDCVYQASPLTFDPSIVEIFTTLHSGATLVLFPEDTKTHPQHLANCLSSHNVTVIQATPSLIASIGRTHLSTTLLSKDSRLKVLALGGERCPSYAAINSWRAHGNHTNIINMYGITEVSSWAMYHILSEQDARRQGIPLGQPFYNTVICVEPWNEVPGKHSDLGQIYIGGSSRFCFIDNDDDVSSSADDDGDIASTMRATGDLVRLDEGYLYYFGRTDEQIKHNGKKINLTEIENVCEQHPGVQKASAIFDHPRLYLFLLITDNHCQVADAEKLLKERLPRYNLPNDIIAVDKMPVTQHGKVDKKELLQKYYTQQINAKLMTLWKRFTYQSSGVDGDLLPDVRFTECGGDSMSAIRFVDTIESKIIGYCLPENRLLDIILNSNFSSLVNCVKKELYDKMKTSETSGISGEASSVRDDVQVSHHLPLSIDKDKWSDDITSTKTSSQNFLVSSHKSFLDIPLNTNESITEGRSHIEDNFNKIPTPKRFKYGHLDIEGSSRATSSGYFVSGSDILSISRTSQIQIHDQESIKRIDPERLHDLCSPRVEMTEFWKFNMGKCVDSSPLIKVTRTGNMTVYIGSHSKHCTLAAVNLHNGKQIWSVSLNTRIEATPTLSKCGQYIVVGAYDHNVYIYEALGGVLHWKYTTGDQVKDSASINPINGKVYIGSHDHNIYCLDIQARRCQWETNVAGCVFASPCISMEPYHLYSATTKGDVYCLNPDVGDAIWYLPLASPVFSSPLLTPDGICVGTVNHMMYLLTHKGEKVWCYQCDGPIFSSPSLYIPPRLEHSIGYNTQQDLTQLNQTSHRARHSFYCVFGCHSSDVICLSGEGKLLWQHKMASQVYSSPFVINDGLRCKRPLVVVCCTSGEVHVLDLDSGRLLGCSQLEGGQIFSSPVIWNNHLVVGCRDNNVYCLQLSLRYEHFMY